MKLGMLKLTSGVLEGIRESERTDLELVDYLALINQGRVGDFKIDDNGVIKFRDKICVPEVPELKKSILQEGH